jgi:hypothetical protein
MRPIQILSAVILLSGLSFLSCNRDNCEGNYCDHGGICKDGNCDCPTGYIGPHCTDQVTPLKMKVKAVTVTRFPATNDGMSWDPTDGPDIFFKMSEEVYPLAQPEHLIENADAAIDYTFNIVSFDLRYVTSPYKMELFDYEGVGIPAQKMGEMFFTPYSTNNGFPTTLILDDGGSIAFTIEVQYFFPEEMD